MKNKYLFALLFMSSFAVADSYTDKAEVLSFDKIYRNQTISEPYKDCYIKEFYQSNDDGSATNEIIGGIFGGIIGNQFGKGDGKDALTLAGAVLGASLARDDEIKNSKNGRTILKEVCETKYHKVSKRVLSHYLVEFYYDERVLSYITKNKPRNKQIRVVVTVEPEDIL